MKKYFTLIFSIIVLGSSCAPPPSSESTIVIPIRKDTLVIPEVKEEEEPISMDYEELYRNKFKWSLDVNGYKHREITVTDPDSMISIFFGQVAMSKDITCGGNKFKKNDTITILTIHSNTDFVVGVDGTEIKDVSYQFLEDLVEMEDVKLTLYDDKSGSVAGNIEMTSSFEYRLSSLFVVLSELEIWKKTKLSKKDPSCVVIGRMD